MHFFLAKCLCMFLSDHLINQMTVICLFPVSFSLPQNISPEELKLELPERQPRFVVYSYKYVHDDGRVSYPLCFIFSSPVGEDSVLDSLEQCV